MRESDDLGNIWTRPKRVGIGAIATCAVAAAAVGFFAAGGKTLEALLATTATLCLLVVGLMDMLAELIRSTRRVATAVGSQRSE